MSMDWLRSASILPLITGLAACATPGNQDLVHARLGSLERTVPVAPVAEATALPEVETETPASPGEVEVEAWQVPSLAAPPQAGAVAGEDRPRLRGPSVNVTLPAQSVASFVNTVLGEVLELPYSLGPGVAERVDIVTLRSVRDMDRETFFQLFEAALEEYGLALVYKNGLVQVVERSTLRSEAAQFMTSKARPSASASVRPVTQFVILEATDAAEMEAILRVSFPDSAALGIQARRDVSALTLSGLSDDVDAAMAMIEQLDNLRFAGAEALSLSPRNWKSGELANTLRDILSIEGYQVTLGAGASRAITLMPINRTNQLLVFTDSAASMRHVVDTARRLDEAAAVSEVRTTHIYQVKSRDAQELATIAESILGEASKPPEDGAPAAAPGRMTIDEVGNRIVFVATQAEFKGLERVLRELDTPAPEVLIEVTIAEVTLSDDERFGLEFIVNTFGGDFELRTLGGLGLESGGLSAVLRSGDLNLSAAAFSSKSHINILSTPRIVTRSGSEASVQVGTDVPIITSQRAADTQQTGDTDILQTIQFRSTGVLLNVKPRVYSNDRIDLFISQEVSAAQPNPNQAIASPIISNRSLTSDLSLQDGQTAVLGGLMERRVNSGKTAVPILSRVPFLGRLFSTQSTNSDRTVLLVLVTPHLLNNREDRERVAKLYSDEAQRAFAIPMKSSEPEMRVLPERPSDGSGL
jgi:general secretion pathway protein D